jgi:hypothetical protein
MPGGGADWAPANEGTPMRYNPDEDRRFTIRLEDDLREALSAEAQRQMRSLASEIKFRLRQTLVAGNGGADVRAD